MTEPRALNLDVVCRFVPLSKIVSRFQRDGISEGMHFKLQQAIQHPARTPSDGGGSVAAIRSRSSLSACGSTWSAAIMARTKGSERMSA
jgi:hypothetical protein